MKDYHISYDYAAESIKEELEARGVSLDDLIISPVAADGGSSKFVYGLQKVMIAVQVKWVNFYGESPTIRVPVKRVDQILSKIDIDEFVRAVKKVKELKAGVLASMSKPWQEIVGKEKKSEEHAKAVQDVLDAFDGEIVAESSLDSLQKDSMKGVR